MFGKKHREAAPATAGGPASSQGEPAISLRDAAPEEKPLRRDFPGPRGARSPLRVAIDRGAHAELIAHAKGSLDAEICGVLAGRVCEDDEGLFVHVQAAIRGTAASEKSTRVTFTHATWTAIHQTLERDHPQLKIVGWYHSHPGFGVEFSEMDLFIQRNFFSSPTRIALVTDPLNGAVAICVNTPRGIQYLPRYWVDGREQECKVPAQSDLPSADAASAAPGSNMSAAKIQDLESRVGQLVLSVDELRGSLHRFLIFAGVLFCLCVITVAGYAIYLRLQARVEPPRNIGFAPVPVQIGEHTALLGVAVVSWELPPELDISKEALRQAVEQIRQELEQAAGKAGSNALPMRPDSQPPPARP